MTSSQTMQALEPGLDASSSRPAADHERRLGPLRLDLRLLALAGAVAFAVYGYEIFNFTLSVDEEVHTFVGDSAAAWIGQGRWGMALLTVLLPPLSTTPFLSTVLFCAGLAVAAALVAPVVVRGRAEGAFFVVLLVASPVWPHLVQFSTIAFGIGVGLAAVGIAAQGVTAPGRWPLLWSVLALAFATAIYQTLPLAFVVVVLLAVAAGGPAGPVDEPAPRSPWATLFRGALCALAALLLYNAVRLAVQRAFASSGYIDVFLNWRDFLVSFDAASIRTGRFVREVLDGSHAMYAGEGLAFQLVSAGGLLGFLFGLLGRRERRAPARWLAVAALCCAVAVSMMPAVIAAGYAPARTLVPFPFAFAVVGACSLRLPGPSWPKWGVLGLVALTATWIVVALFYSDATARKRDELIAATLAHRIGAAAPLSTEPVPFVLVGYLRHAEDRALRRIEAFGVSFFEHDFGNPWRVEYYLRLLGVRNLVPQSVAAALPILPEIELMPSWPAPGSVALVNGLVVVKLGPLSYPQERALQAAREAAERP